MALVRFQHLDNDPETLQQLKAAIFTSMGMAATPERPGFWLWKSSSSTDVVLDLPNDTLGQSLARLRDSIAAAGVEDSFGNGDLNLSLA